MTTVSFWSHHCQAKGSGDQQRSSGCLKVLQMQTGRQTRGTAVPQAAEYTWYAVHLHMVPPEPRR